MHVRGSPGHCRRRHERRQTHRGPGARGVHGRRQWERCHRATRTPRLHGRAPANPLRSLSNDSAYIVSVLDSIKGPIVLVGHSYGGSVISSAAAGNPRVKSLVYVSALMPDKGESAAAPAARFPSASATATTSIPYRAAGVCGTDVYIRPDGFHEVFAADLPQSTTKLMAATQRLAGEATFSEKAKVAGNQVSPLHAFPRSVFHGRCCP
ncbi:alpha/beta hydrolase [Streptomyces sp. NPDC048295]|uniref:alpha/beta fold hydrolase n=1 Tax=Streptomyces sp. NPDC048295 TaxID=3154617 RepID=UPI00342A0F0B